MYYKEGLELSELGQPAREQGAWRDGLKGGVYEGCRGGGCTSALGKRLDKETAKKASSLNVLFAAFLDLNSTCLRKKKKKKQSKCK